jgi:hypothetical protein
MKNLGQITKEMVQIANEIMTVNDDNQSPNNSAKLLSLLILQVVEKNKIVDFHTKSLIRH